MKIRHEAKKAFAHADSSNRTAKAMLRKAAPLVGDYRVGGPISFQREKKSRGIARKRWSSASRIIGFEGHKVCWVICEGIPYCIATDRMRPANESEAPAYQYLRDHEAPMPRGQQQSFVDHSVQPDEDEEEAPDPVASSDEELIPAGQQQSDLEDEDEIRMKTRKLVGRLSITSERMKRSERDLTLAKGLNGRSGERSLQEDLVEEQS
jgi:hypothetical protein